jgi:SPP1 family predicted phage head-tail adaptor
VEAGKLDRQIIIEQATVTNPGGDVTETWATFATVWAQIVPLTRDELFGANAIQNAQTATFRIRYLSGLNQKMRINYDSKYWYITSITYIGRDETMDVIATGGE